MTSHSDDLISLDEIRSMFDRYAGPDTPQVTYAARRKLARLRLAALAAAFTCLGGGGAAVALTLTASPSHPQPPGDRHGPAGGNGTATIGTSPNCGIETQTYPQPPTGFDPTTATAAQLKEYGFPPRPSGDTSSPAVQAWLKAMAAWKTTDVPEPTCSTDQHRPPPRH